MDYQWESSDRERLLECRNLKSVVRRWESLQGGIGLDRRQHLCY